MNKRHYIIPIFVPHTGCPNDCVFCNQRKITGISTDVKGEEVKTIIDEYLSTIPDENRTLEIAFFGGSFTGIEIETQKEFLDIANSYKKMGLVNEIRLSTRPDYIDETILNHLKKRGVDTIELGIQSLDEEVLIESNRGHKREDVFVAAKLIKNFGFYLGVQMMLGLPGDNEKKSIQTAKELINLDPKIARIYPTLVIRETELEKSFLNNTYKPMSIEKSVELSKKILLMFEEKAINVIRVGLQPTENINYDGEVVAGPFHPSYRHLVEEKIYFEILDRAIKYFLDKYNLSKEFNNKKNTYILDIEVNNSKISYISGHKKANKIELIKKHELKDIRIKGNDRIENNLIIRNELLDLSETFNISKLKSELI